jgi:hypothetical protein
MARHERRFSGSNPALCLSLILRKPEDEQRLFLLVKQALGQRLTCTLVADPFWLLGADAITQREVAAFLLHWAGGHQALERALSVRGLPASEDVAYASLLDDDARLLLELFHQFEPHEADTWGDLHVVTCRARAALAGARLEAPEEFPVLLWVDVRYGDSHVLKKTARQLWNHEPLLHLGYLKLLVGEEVSLESTALTWNRCSLKAMLERRATQVGMNDGRWRYLYEYLGEQDPIEQLVSEAQGTPAGLIRAGNALLERYGTSFSDED